jgi:hypothetical protein
VSLTTRRYRWASLVIDCDLPLPELMPAARTNRPDVVVRRAPASPRRTVRTPCHQWRLPDGTRWGSVARGDGDHLLRFQRFADFVVANRGRSIRWRAPATTKPETIRHLLLDQVLPAIAVEHSLIGLHASAVVIGGQGIAFAGPTSRGKSTLAASLAVDGHAVVTDDCLMLEWRRREPRAVPSYPALRLWKATADRLLGPTPGLAPVAEYTSKVRIGAGVAAIAFRRHPVRVCRIYLVERRRGAARIDVLSRRQAYVELLKMTFRLDPLDRVGARREMEALGTLARRVPVSTPRLPLRLDGPGALDAVRRAIIADLPSRRRPPRRG